MTDIDLNSDFAKALVEVMQEMSVQVRAMYLNYHEYCQYITNDDISLTLTIPMKKKDATLLLAKAGRLELSPEELEKMQ